MSGKNWMFFFGILLPVSVLLSLRADAAEEGLIAYWSSMEDCISLSFLR